MLVCMLYICNDFIFYVNMVYLKYLYIERDFLKCTLCSHAVALQEQREGFAIVRCCQ